MIRGVGVDLVHVDRMNGWLEKPRLLDRFFPQGELDYVRARGLGAAESLAARFAAKEALGKSLGRGLGGLNPKEIEVAVMPSGAPYIILHGGTKETIAAMGNFSFYLSLAHEGGLAIAVVVTEETDV